MGSFIPEASIPVFANILSYVGGQVGNYAEDSGCRAVGLILWEGWNAFSGRLEYAWMMVVQDITGEMWIYVINFVIYYKWKARVKVQTYKHCPSYALNLHFSH